MSTDDGAFRVQSESPRDTLQGWLGDVLNDLLALLPVELDDRGIADSGEGVGDLGDSARKQLGSILIESQAPESADLVRNPLSYLLSESAVQDRTGFPDARSQWINCPIKSPVTRELPSG